MIIAELKNKIRQDIDPKRSEDLFTSAVFGRIRYLPPDEVLIPFLSMAQMAFGTDTLSCLSEHSHKTTKYVFWPKFRSGKEPDLLIFLDDPDSPNESKVILIEIKYHSPKSSRDNELGTTKDQLAYYFSEFMNNSFKEDLKKRIAHIPEKNLYMIYITKHRYKPMEELNESLESSVFNSLDGKKLKKKFIEKLHWLSWRELEPIVRKKLLSEPNRIKKARKKLIPPQRGYRAIYGDLQAFLLQRDITFAPPFSGFDLEYKISTVPRIRSDILFYTGCRRYRWPQEEPLPILNLVFYKGGGHDS